MFHLYLEKIAHFYPESKFIILHRDPRDQCLARFRMQKRKDVEKSYYRISNAWKYVYTKLLKLKNKIGSDRFLDIKYEDVVLNTEIELKKICLFLGIPYQEAMLNYDEQINKEAGKTTLDEDLLKEFTLFHEGIRQKVNKDKIGIWKQDLKSEEANLIWTICGELGEKIGYKRDEHFIKQRIKFKDYLTNIPILRVRIVTFLYHSSPFFVKYLVKKVKYSKQFNSNGCTSEEFYKKSYHNN